MAGGRQRVNSKIPGIGTLVGNDLRYDARISSKGITKTLAYLLILFRQFFVISIRASYPKIGRLEPIISADAISITTIEQFIFNVVVPAIKFAAVTSVIAAGFGVVLALWQIQFPGTAREKVTETHAKQYFISCKQKWPWFTTPTRLPELNGNP